MKRANNTSATNQAVGYIRVSTLDQSKHGVSMEAQEDRLRAYCLAAGLELVAVIREDGVSASVAVADRPKGGELIAALKRVTNVVALKLDRLFRDAEDALRQTRAWDRAGVALHLVDMGGQSINTATAMGRMMLTMMAAFAELERNLIAERTAQALQFKRSNRQVYNHEPYGYRRDGNALVAVPEEQGVISCIRALLSNGDARRDCGETEQRGDTI